MRGNGQQLVHGALAVTATAISAMPTELANPRQKESRPMRGGEGINMCPRNNNIVLQEARQAEIVL
jgi:hypothetical protein